MALLLLGAGRSSSSFSPSSIDGLSFWLDADASYLLTEPSARQFTAANSEQLTRANQTELQSEGGSFLWSVWVYIDSDTGLHYGRYAVYKGTGTGTGIDYAISYYDLTIMNCGVGDGSSFVTVDLGAYSIQTWYCIQLVYDADNQIIKARRNNEAWVSTAFTGTPQDSTNDLRFGCDTTAHRYHDGKLASCAFCKSPTDSLDSVADYFYNNGIPLKAGDITAAKQTSTGLVEFWPLNEYEGDAIGYFNGLDLTDNNTVTSAIGPGTDKIADESSNANHGTITGFTNTGDIISTDVPSALAGSLDYSMEFGVGTLVVPDDAALDFTDELTLAFHIKFNTLGLNTLISKHEPGYDTGWVFYYDDGANSLYLQHGNGTTPWPSSSTSVSWTPSVGVEYHLAVTKSGTSVKFYVDGVQQGATQTAAMSAIAVNSDDVWIGGNVDSPSSYKVDGLMADVVAYNTALSDANIALLAAGTAVGTPVGQWGGSNDSFPIGAVVDGQPVIRATDRSGNSVDVESTTLAKRPIYDSANSGISFDGVDDLADLVGSLSVTDFTIFAVATLSNTVTSATPAMRLIASQTDGAAGNARGSLTFGDVGLPSAETLTALAYTGSVDNKSYGSGITSTIAAGKYLITTKLDGTTTSIRIDGVGQSLTQIGLNGLLDSSDGARRFNQTAWRIAANFLTTANLDGTIHCILIYDSGLSGDDIASVESYLSGQYGLGL